VDVCEYSREFRTCVDWMHKFPSQRVKRQDSVMQRGGERKSGQEERERERERQGKVTLAFPASHPDAQKWESVRWTRDVIHKYLRRRRGAVLHQGVTRDVLWRFTTPVAFRDILSTRCTALFIPLYLSIRRRSLEENPGSRMFKISMERRESLSFVI